jgi:catalase
VFFIRDTMNSPHSMRSQKRHGGSGRRDNNMQWDFWSLNPESAHQVTYLMGDRGIPKTYLNGYGSHTYLWVDATGWATSRSSCTPAAPTSTGGQADDAKAESDHTIKEFGDLRRT